MPGEPSASIAFIAAAIAEDYQNGPFIVVVRSRREFARWLRDPKPGAEAIQVEGLIGDPEVWALAAQGTVNIPLDVVLEDPGAEFSALYRLVDVRMVRGVRVTIPAKPGFLKAARLAASLQLPVRILPGQPDEAALAGLSAAVDFYLRDSMVEAPIEFFHSLLAVFRGLGAGTLWTFLEEDPAIFLHHDAPGNALRTPDFVESHLSRLISEGAECATCPWQIPCAGYFKVPHPAYDCAGVKQLFASIRSAADEITQDLTTREITSSI